MPEGPGVQVCLRGLARAQPSPSSLGYRHDTHHQGLHITTRPSKGDEARLGLRSGGSPSPEARTGPSSSASLQAAPAPGPSQPLPAPSTPPAPHLDHAQPGQCGDPTASWPLAPPGFPELPGTRVPQHQARGWACETGELSEAGAGLRPLGGDAEFQVGGDCVQGQTQAIAPQPQPCSSQSQLGQRMRRGAPWELPDTPRRAGRPTASHV